MLKRGMYPTVSRFIDDFSHFFVTVGAIGLNEMCMNFFGDPTKGIDTPEGKQLSIEVIQFMNKQLSKFQVAHKDFYGPNRPILANLELVPGEGCMHRFARHDKIAFPDIITANGTGGDYYTRGCWLPADKQYSLSFATKHQEELQDMFSGGANFQYYINEPIHDWRAVRSIVKKIVTNTSLPFVSISPTISVCPICGVLQNNQDYCEHELSKEQIAELKAKGVEVIE
jgi:ribonucleoside-triphosphate reductase